MSALRIELLGPILIAVGLCMGAAVPRQQTDTPRVIDVLSYTISLEIGPEPTSFAAQAEIIFEVRADVTELVRFDFVGLTVDSVYVDRAPASHRRNVHKLEVELGRRAEVGDTVTVSVHYHGVPEDGLIFRRNAHGRPTAFADNWPARARYWLPSVDHPGDKARVEFRVTAPPNWNVVANGRLVDERPTGDGRKATVWVTDRPIPVYTMVVGAGQMVVREVGKFCADGSERCVPITQWSYLEDEGRAAELFARAPEIVAFFDSLIGPFPYEKLALVQSTTRFGGMENSSAIFFAEGLASGRRGDGLVAHEIAHQWFGDAVTEGEWTHLWLSEGFATYFASVFFEFADGDAEAATARSRSEQRYMASVADVERPIIDEEPDDLFRLLNSNNYQKGAWVLHMLRQHIGDEAFFAGIRRYYARFLHGNALSADLQRVMEESSGQDLEWFFDQWLRRPGFPQVEVRRAWVEKDKTLELHVIQSNSWGLFRFPLLVEVAGDGFRLRRTFWIEERESHLAWPLPAQPRRVIADPENALLGPTRVVE